MTAPTYPPEGVDHAEETTFHLLRRAVARSPLGRMAGGLHSSTALEVALALLMAAASFLGAVPGLHAYRVVGAPLILVLAATLSTLLTHVGVRVGRLAPPVTFALSAVGLVLVLFVLGGLHPGDAVSALTSGPGRLMSETLPLSGGRVLLAPLVVVVWVVAAAVSESLTRRAHRLGASPVVLVLPVGVYVLCYAAASAAPTHDRLAGPILLVVLAAAAVVHSQISAPVEMDQDLEARPPSRWRVTAGGVVTAGAVAAALGVAATTVPGLREAPVALHRRLPVSTPLINDPVDVMAQLRDGSPLAAAAELTVSLSGPSTGYLAMADLDDYDGGQWRFGAVFAPTGGRIPGDGAVGPLDPPEVTQVVDLTGRLPLPLLPALDRPRMVSGLDVAADPVTGMLVPLGSSAGASYTVVSRAPAARLGDLSAVDGVDTTLGGADLAIPPGTAADLATTERFVSNLTGGLRPSASISFLQAVAAALRTKERRVDPTLGPAQPSVGSTTSTTAAPTASPGTSLSEVINAVTVNRSATPEQFATFYAMIARYLGVPARVVTGFRLATGASAPLLGPGTYRATNRQAWTWVEVPVSGYGWVVADPTPDLAVAASQPPPESVSAPATTLPSRPANAVPRSEIAGGHPLAPAGHIAPTAARGTPLWVPIVAALGGLALLLAVGGPGQAALRRAWRRRCRRSGDPGRLAVGAWLELLDGLDRAGLRPLPGATATEVAAEIGRTFGAEYLPEAEGVAAAADRAVFSSSPPPAAVAEKAWADSSEMSRRVRSGLDLRQRIRATVTVGSAPIRPSAGRR